MLKLQFRDRRQESVCWWMTVSISSAQKTDLVIKSGTVQGHHADITQTTTGQLFVKDLGSPGGTYLNGGRIAVTKIKAGDVLKLGDVELELIDLKSRLAHLRQWYALPPNGVWWPRQAG